MWTALNRSGELERQLELLLRIGVAGCFIGHGAFGVIGKSGWLPYFAAVGIGEDLAWTLMPIVGGIDILVGVLALVSPRPAVLMYAAFWALWTAALRPLAGESVFETLERAGNYGIPIAFMVLAGIRMDWSTRWFRVVQVGPRTGEREALLRQVLQWTTALLLIGHGGLALAGKPLLVEHLAVLGLPEGSVFVLGAVEWALAAAVLARPVGWLLLGILGWKLATEALFPISGAPFWEFVERAGSYIAPLALWTMVRSPAATTSAGRRLARDGAAVLIALFLSAGAAWVPEEGDRPTAGGLLSMDPDPSVSQVLLDELRSGGLVLACRHAATDRSRPDARTVDFGDPSTQRVLSPEGRRQAARMGNALRELEIPLGPVLASPYDRASETARLAFGRMDVDRALMDRRPRGNRDLPRLFGSEPPAGTNRVLVSHQWVLYPMLPGVEQGSIREGDCLVLRPQGEGPPEVLGRFGPDDWKDLEGRDSGRHVKAGAGVGANGGVAVDTAVRGDATLLCRHAGTTDFREVEPVDYDDPGTQRRLSREGEEQARSMGRAMSARGVLFSEVVASPMDRAARTAELMAERPPIIEAIWHTNGGSYRGPALEARRAALSLSPGEATRLIVSHIGTIASVIPDARGRLEEGDCVVVEGEPSGFTVVGFVPWGAW